MEATGEILSDAKVSLFTLANLLTLCRALLVLPCAWLVYQEQWLLAAALFTAAALSDYYDGRLARARNQTSALGGVFDHGTDASFVSLSLFAAGLGEHVTLWLAPLVALAFIQYVLDSSVLKGKPLRGNWLGRSNGIAYFVLTGCVIGVPLVSALLGIERSISGRGLRDLLYWSSVLLCVTTATSMLIRGLYWRRYAQD